MIRLWKGYHSPELLPLIQKTWENSELLILCPPQLTDLEFIKMLPAGPFEFCGDWDNSPQHCSSVSSIQDGSKFSNLGASYAVAPILGLFTSGTVSGSPRLVLYSRENIESSLAAILDLFDLSRIKKIFCYPQPFHTFGLVLGYMFAAIYQRELIIGTGRYSNQFHEQWLSEHSPNLLTLGTPTHFQDLIQFIKSQNIKPRLSYSCIMGGAVVSVSLWNAVKNDLAIESPSIGYGATEAAPGITHHPPGLKPKEDCEIGFPLSHLKVKIDEDRGIEFAGKSVCLAIIQDGKVDFPKKILIKDKIRCRTDGMLIYQGRYELILNRGGQKFSLEQIEKQLSRDLGLETLCVSVPHPRLGEDLGLLVKNASIEKKPIILKYLIEKYAAQFTLDSLWFVSEFPTNSSLKVDRKKAVESLLQRDLHIQPSAKLKFPIPVSQFQEWVPHRSPMVWVDEVTQVSADQGECAVILKAGALYMGADGVRQSSFIEWIAQSYAYVRTAQHFLEHPQDPKKPKEVFLVGIRDATYFCSTNDPALKPGQRLLIQVSGARELGPLTLFTGSVQTESGHRLFAVSLKVYSA